MTFSVKHGYFTYKNSDLPSKKILKDINFSVKKGELISILGPNGVGKTTLLRCMMGFLRWTKGESYLDGRDIRTLPPKQLWQKIAYVPQARGKASSYTVEQMVLMGRSSHFGMFSKPSKEDKQIALSALEQLRLTKLAKRKCSVLSGGELQMVLIARALAADPEILILDEPESNLDFKNQLIIMETIQTLSNKGISCIFNTHYPDHALQYSEKALLLYYDGEHAFGDAGQVITEKNLAEAFGVKVLVNEVETPYGQYKDILPMYVLPESY